MKRFLSPLISGHEDAGRTDEFGLLIFVAALRIPRLRRPA